MVNQPSPYPVLTSSIENARSFHRQMRSLLTFMYVVAVGWGLGHAYMNWIAVNVFVVPLLIFSTFAYLFYRGFLALIDYAATTVIVGAAEAVGSFTGHQNVDASDSADETPFHQNPIANLFDLDAFRRNPISDKEDGQ